MISSYTSLGDPELFIQTFISDSYTRLVVPYMVTPAGHAGFYVLLQLVNSDLGPAFKYPVPGQDMALGSS